MNSTTRFLLPLFLLVTTLLHGQIFVDQDAMGANDGSSWANAFTKLEMAILAAEEGDQLWVAAGTYIPGEGTSAPDTSFLLTQNLEMYGGFNGTETTLSERDWETHITALSGDKLGDDDDDDYTVNRSDNCDHVMDISEAVTEATIIDGFTIRNAEAGNDPHGFRRRGGGITTEGNPTIRNCTFLYNNSQNDGGAIHSWRKNLMSFSNCTFRYNYTGNRGAGIFVLNGSVSIQDCEFEFNIAESGGGAVNYGGSSDDSNPVLIINNCVFNENFGSDIGARGGAVGCSGSANTVASITNSVFTNNFSETSAGALGISGNFQLTVSNCQFDNNTTPRWGGAIYCSLRDSVLNITDCVIRNNFAGFTGGGLYVNGGLLSERTAALHIDRVYIQENTAGQGGGGIYIGDANVDISNSVIHGNEVIDLNGAGGALHIENEYQPIAVRLINTTLANNDADLGTGIWQTRTATDSIQGLQLQNCILDNPSGDNYDSENGATISSLGGNLSADGSMLDILTNTNDLNNQAPLFVGSTGNYRLSADSPCINKGIATGASETDIEGTPRVGLPDMGAYEYTGVSSTGSVTEVEHIQIFPNPVKNQLHFTLSTDWDGPLSIQVLNQGGQVLQTEQLPSGHRDQSYTIFAQKLPAGSYHLRISNEQVYHTKLFLKL